MSEVKYELRRVVLRLDRIESRALENTTDICDLEDRVVALKGKELRARWTGLF
jgi:hypothetical protein